MRRVEVRVTGVVQGVGFRPFVHREAVLRRILEALPTGVPAVANV